MIRKRVLVSGRVQAVFFRDSCRREALAHNVTGWVRNLADRRVEAVFEGSEADVAYMVEWTRHGPTDARVHNVEVLDETPEGLRSFRIAG